MKRESHPCNTTWDNDKTCTLTPCCSRYWGPFPDINE